MTNCRLMILAPILSLLAGLACPCPAAAHGGSFGDIHSLIIKNNCLSCHSPGAGNNGGFAPGPSYQDSPENNESAWYTALVNARPLRGAASSLGKLRVTPYQPWNSYLLDKLTGDLKLGEGRPMPIDQEHPYGQNCPGAIDKITSWILAGAARTGYTGDSSPGTVPCDKSQPGFSAPQDPPAELKTVQPFTVEEPLREEESETNMSLAADMLVGRIRIAASAGTEYVSVTRQGDAVPLVVARGPEVDLELPQGVAIEIHEGEPLTVRQRIRNDYWQVRTSCADSPCSTYVNRTIGQVALYFYPSSADPAAVRLAEPLIDELGTRALVVPPRSLGQTGGVWAPAPGAVASGAMLGVWSDRRLLEASIANASDGSVLVKGPLLGAPAKDLTNSYFEVGGGDLSGVVYQCTHSNGFTNTNENAVYLSSLSGTTAIANRPMKFACQDFASPNPSLPPVPPGKPSLLGLPPAVDCVRSINDFNPSQSPELYHDSECENSTVDSCIAANLTGGRGVNEGRCTLIGLTW